MHAAIRHFDCEKQLYSFSSSVSFFTHDALPMHHQYGTSTTPDRLQTKPRPLKLRARAGWHPYYLVVFRMLLGFIALFYHAAIAHIIPNTTRARPEPDRAGRRAALRSASRRGTRADLLFYKFSSFTSFRLLLVSVSFHGPALRSASRREARPGPHAPPHEGAQHSAA